MPLSYSDYASAYKAKYDRENQSDALSNIAGALGTGVGTGIVKGMEAKTTSENEAMKARKEIFMSTLKDNILYDKQTGQPVSPEQIALIGEAVAKGESLGNNFGLSRIKTSANQLKDTLFQDRYTHKLYKIENGVETEFTGDTLGYTIKQRPTNIAEALKYMNEATGGDYPVGATISASGVTVPLNRPMTQEQGQTVAGTERVKNDVNSLLEIMDRNKDAFSAIGLLKTKLPYLVVGGDTEEIKRLSDQLGARIPFAKGGKQLTEMEDKKLRALLPQPGQNEETIRKNLKGFIVEFENLSKAATEGIIGGREVIAPKTTPSPKVSPDALPAVPSVGQTFQGGKVLNIKRIK